MSQRTQLKESLLRMLPRVHAHRITSRYRRDKLLIACYHGVTESGSASLSEGYRYDTVPVAEFTRHLEMLARWFRFVDLAEALDWTESSPVSARPPALITFDDGYKNNLEVAAPVLKRMGIPAVFFLTTGYIGTDRLLWPAEIGARIDHSAAMTVPLPDGRSKESIPREPSARRAMATRIRSLCKSLADDDRISYLEQLRSATHMDRSKIDDEVNSFLSWDDARRLVSFGFEIGSHTVEHPILSRVGLTELRNELHNSRETLQRELNLRISTLAYPNGGEDDFNSTVMKEAALTGYTHAFAVGDTFHRQGGETMAIRRMIVPGGASESLFYFIASGCRDILRRS